MAKMCSLLKTNSKLEDAEMIGLRFQFLAIQMRISKLVRQRVDSL